MTKKALSVFAVLMIMVLLISCKEKQIASPAKEAVPVINFDSSKVSAKVPAGVIDAIEPERVLQKGSIRIGGWAYDPQKMLPAKGVVIIVDGKQLSVPVHIGLKRADVAKALSNDNLTMTGLDTSFSAASLGKGKHKLEVYAVLFDGTFAPLLYKGKTFAGIDVEDK